MKQKYILLLVTTALCFMTATVMALGLWLESTYAHERVHHTHLVIESLQRVAGNISQCESGLRGYIETGDRRFVDARDTAVANLHAFLQSLGSLVADNPDQQVRLDRIDALVQEKLAWQEQVLSEFKQNGFRLAAQLQETRKGVDITKRMQEEISVMRATESQLLRARQQEYYITKVLLCVTIVLLYMIGLMFLAKAVQFGMQSSRFDEQRKAALKQLDSMNHDLNEQVTDLIKARADLEKAVNTRSQFLANVSHELRTPLSGIIGATEVVLSMPLLEEQRGLIAIAKNCADGLLSLVNDLLDFARIESHVLQLNPSEFALIDFVQATLEPLKQRAKAKGLEFHLHSANDLPSHVVGDSARIRQVLTNLVDNAVKFTEKGNVTVDLSVRSENSEHLMVSFKVIDTGIGIAPDQLDVIFDRFVQLDGSTTRRQTGAGLGLSISKSLAELMHGRIEVFSNPGFGSQFSLIIPLEQSTQRVPSTTELKAVILRPDLERILVVDDSDVIRAVVSAQLKKLGFVADTASTGAEAIAATKKQSYALVLMDVGMPVMDGFMVTHAIRTDVQNLCHQTPIIALTAHAMPQDREQCLRVGMSDYMAKPVPLASLQAMLAKWVPNISTQDCSGPRGTILTGLVNRLLDCSG